jgi:hypothetical protein
VCIRQRRVSVEDELSIRPSSQQRGIHCCVRHREAADGLIEFVQVEGRTRGSGRRDRDGRLIGDLLVCRCGLWSSYARFEVRKEIRDLLFAESI